ncbi:MAG: SDR family NAD(P)-dependent oxidoreductase [Alphaproteobacteria bacterium]|nr:SDR family NAD(P)-dependent oxidoreductase [Alphaproteobacteria bacterium]
MRDPQSILITGASSGIGAALAHDYAKPATRLALSGRDPARLDAVAAGCQARGAEVSARVLDVADAEAMAAWIATVNAEAPLDLVIANAGISSGSSGRGETGEQARRIFAVNVTGVLNTVLPALEMMRARPASPTPRGQIALMSSVASFRGFAGAPAYCGSKAALRVWGEGLRALHAGEGIELSVICPGFVRSRMTEVNRFPMPFLMDAERAARIIRRGLERNRGRITFPWQMVLITWLLGAMPAALADRLTAALPAKADTPV